MAMQAKELIEEIETLPEIEKLKLVDLILTQLDQPDPELDKVWAAESRMRWEAYKRGEVDALPYEQVMEKYRHS